MPGRFRREMPPGAADVPFLRGPRLGVVTVVTGAQATRNLLLQRTFLRDLMPGLRQVVVADEAAQRDASTTIDELSADPDVRVLTLEPAEAGSAMGRGYNVGVRALLEDEYRLVLLLHPDSIPLPGLLRAYGEAVAWGGAYGSWLFNGPVTYLGERDDLSTMSAFRARRLTNPAPERVFPPVGDVMSNDDHHLFLADNVAICSADWRTVGGFDEHLDCPRAQERDFAARCRAAGMGMAWVGGAHVLRAHPDAGALQLVNCPA